jgi:catechol 2,3-dioxygenase-like lactoylglutathione lyase family enzyme
MKLEGIHHITCITADARTNVDFYARVLGLRMVKKTVNQDDPSVYHLFYADEEGSPGADLTFFEFPGVPVGRAGDGMVHRIVWRVGSTEALDFWAERLGGERVETVRDGDRLRFRNHEGLEHELAVVETPDEPLVANHPEVPRELALQGFDGVRAYSSDPERSRGVLEEALAFEPAGDAAPSTRTTSPPRSRAYRAPAACTTSRGPRTTRTTSAGASASSRRGCGRRRSSTASGFGRCTSASRAESSSSSRPSVRASPRTSRRSTWARRSCCRRGSRRGAPRSRRG